MNRNFMMFPQKRVHFFSAICIMCRLCRKRTRHYVTLNSADKKKYYPKSTLNKKST